MDIFTILWNNWTNYQKIFTGIAIILCYIILSFFTYIFTKNRKLSFFSIISLTISGILTIISFIVMRTAFDILITQLFLVSPVIIIFINILNIGTLIGFYSSNSRNKQFTFETLYTEFLRDTFKLSFVLITLFCLCAIFVSSMLLFLLISSLIVSIISIWINYILLPSFMK